MPSAATSLQALREREARFATVLAQLEEVVFETDALGRWTFLSPAWQSVTGVPVDESLGRSFAEWVAEDDRAATDAVFAALVDGHVDTCDHRLRLRTIDGGERWIEARARRLVGDDGAAAGTFGTMRDVSAQQRLARDLERSLASLRATLEATADGIVVVDDTHRIVGWSQKFLDMWELDEAIVASGDNEVAMRAVLDRVADPDRFMAGVRAIAADRDGTYFDVLELADGRVYERHAQPQRLGDTVVGRVYSFRDVTARERAQSALARRERELQTLVEHSPDFIMRLDTMQRVRWANPTAARALGRSRDAMLGHTPGELGLGDARAWDERYREVLATGRELRCEGAQQTTFGTRWLETQLVPEHDATGRLVGLLSIARDLTERKRAEDELRRTSEMLRALIDAAPLAVVALDPTWRVTHWSAAATRIFGWRADEVLGGYVPYVPEDRQDELEDYKTRVVRDSVELETQRMRRDGTRIDVRISTDAMRDGDGAIAGYVVLLADITERRQLEERFRQSQKIEAVGQLAGGVAHDFNNLLTAVLGHGELLLRRLPDGERGHASAREIVKAAERAAALTQQLLAFSRKQVLRPRRLSVNDVVVDTESILRRLIGDDVAFDARLDTRLPPVMADPTQLQQVLLNLVVNARDAMAGNGGRVTIETTRQHVRQGVEAHDGIMAPGDYVRLAVVDTGCGMDRATLARIFEPFYTTKEVGKGTGLGLSTVYGIVKQSGGYVWVYSEPGLGTTFHVYLPALAGAADAVPAPPAASTLPAGRGVVLVAEDEDAVRALVTEVLTECGYTVLAAASPDEALGAAARHAGAIDLLLTDVVMPGMTGRELAAHLTHDRPTLPVLYMSGYSDHAIVARGVLDPGVAFIQKPFAPHAIAERVCAMLGDVAHAP